MEVAGEGSVKQKNASKRFKFDSIWGAAGSAMCPFKRTELQKVR